MSGDDADKDHEPTQKKLEDARARGEVARSADLTAAAPWLSVPGLYFVGLLQLAAPAVLAVVLVGLPVASLQRVLPDLRATELLPAARAAMTLLALAAVAPLLGAALLGQLATVAAATAR